ncbi:MAG: M48 family metalloprotease [Solirubrobacterales bacterium]
MLLDDQIRRNRWKSWALFAGFFVVYAAIGAAVSFAVAGWELHANLLVFAIFAAVAIAVVGFTLFMGDDMAVAVAGGRRVQDREQAPELWDAVETMSLAAGIETPRIFVSPDPSPNAFAAGRNQEQALVCANRGLLELLDKEELEGVIAHEISHIRNLDVRLMTYAAVLAGSVALLSEFVLRGAIFSDSDSRGGIVGLIVVVLAALLAPIAALLIQLAISRRREFLADASAADLTRYPQGLGSALRQLASSQARPAHDRNAIAHLYIVPPRLFKEKAAGLFSTHPPISERLARLDGLAGGQVHTHRPRARTGAMEDALSRP